MQIACSPLLTFVALGGALTLVACGGSPEISPVAPAPPASQSDDGGTVSSDGHGPGTGTCTSDCNGTAQGPGLGNGYGPGPGPSDGYCGNACVGPVGPDPADIGAILARALQEEYTAEMLYRHVLASLGPNTAPFALIAEAEARHVAALKLLFTRRSLAPPSWTSVSFPTYASVQEACAGGVAAETADAEVYRPYLERSDLPQDVVNVFTNLQAASLQNHLPAFQRCQ